MNLERPTRCQYYMPNLVAYVVADVVPVGVDVCFGRLQTCRGARVGRQWAKSSREQMHKTRRESNCQRHTAEIALRQCCTITIAITTDGSS